MPGRGFKIKHLPGLLKDSFREWNASDPWRHSAVVAYYALFSLPALLVIIIAIAGMAFGAEAVRGEITTQLGGMLGQGSGKEIEMMVKKAYDKEKSQWAAVIAVITLLFGATGVFYQLQKSLNEIWGVKPDTEGGIKKLLKIRATSFGIVVVIGFLMLISLIITAALSAFSGWMQQFLPDFLIYIFYVIELLFSVALISVLFALIFKVLPDVKIGWRTVAVGGIVTGVLFVLGKFALGLYFGKADPGSAYGAAGSIVLILLWVSYSCLILFFGAEFTKVYARFYGHPMQPTSYAKPEKEA